MCRMAALVMFDGCEAIVGNLKTYRFAMTQKFACLAIHCIYTLAERVSYFGYDRGIS